MKLYFILTSIISLMIFSACAQNNQVEQFDELPQVINDPDNYNELSGQEERVLIGKGTEMAFSGAFHNYKKEGIYICKQCNNPLFHSSDKFDSGTGWPSFDDMIKANVKELPDADGRRTEIVCANCGGHLGHVFRGEGFTEKQTRHCVNSASLNFVSAEKPEEEKKEKGVQPISEYIEGKGYEKYGVATFAGGCFWCTEAAFERIQGVADVISGYSGGDEKYPTYEEVGRGRTGHAESIMIYYDPEVISFEMLLKVFFTAHDPTQLNRQGPDVGEEYRSAIFYHNEDQKAKSEAYFQEFDKSGKYDKPVVTELSPYTQFWVAEAYHQDYYEHHPENPYVQKVSKPKVEKVKKEFAELLKDEYRK